MPLVKPMIALGAIALISMTEVGMASSLLLPSAAQLAGRWQLHAQPGPAQPCTLHLDAAQGALDGDLSCAQALLGMRPASWLITPDTLALVGADGSTVVHFSRQDEHRYSGTSPEGGTLLLERLDIH